MFSQLTFMGVSNSDMLLSEKDLNSMEFNFIVRPALEFEDECDIAPEELHEEDDDDEEEDLQARERQQRKENHQEEKDNNNNNNNDKCKFLISSLNLKLPSLEEFKIQEQDVDAGFKTPTSLNQKIPVIRSCPPAPRKPKSLPSNKRKSLARRVLLDLSNEIESLFPANVLADLGAKIKKVRQENDTK
ncbi:cyclin-dependent protein kinase inhibitor SMR14 [Mercurialis annua]|uniref:cyclin-dependent protein kinase inhibitor SMR14 n=1 Tax=Mercurialis annua TaxID=3986 RepID=UPI00216025EA|nr:cyclin-dependent protein kinase inhibitor SMR14 [Mercurialis annua]